jgi:hypothetical protein
VCYGGFFLHQDRAHVSAVAPNPNDPIATLSFQRLSLQNVLEDRIPSPVSGVNGVTYS